MEIYGKYMKICDFYQILLNYYGFSSKNKFLCISKTAFGAPWGPRGPKRLKKSIFMHIKNGFWGTLGSPGPQRLYINLYINTSIPGIPWDPWGLWALIYIYIYEYIYKLYMYIYICDIIHIFIIYIYI